ncbi:hypothetical protein ACO0RG_004626 [Hanseniaspora osmophila]
MFKQIAHIAQNLKAPLKTQSHIVTGWVKSVRNLKNVMFVDLYDGQQTMKLVIPKNAGAASSTSLSTGACVQLQNFEIVPRVKDMGFELKTVKESILKTIGPITEDYPLQKKQTSVGFLRSWPQYKYNTNYLSSLMKFRSIVENEFAKSLQKSDFINVHAPIITGSDCEGAGEMFSLEAEKDYFKDNAQPYLTVSTQLHLEILAQSLGRVYNISPCFRAEKSDTNRHLTEFWMLEAELCFIEDITELCRVSESMIKDVIRSLYENYNESDILPKYRPVGATKTSSELQTAGPALNNTSEIRANWANLLSKDWQILEYTKVVEILQEKLKVSPSFFKYNNIKWGDELQSEHEKWLASSYCGNSPVFVVNYPASIKPFYMKQNVEACNYNGVELGKTVANFDLLVPGMGEIIGGSLREHNYQTLLETIEERNMNGENLEWYVDLRKNGSAPHGGFGLGLERFVSYLFGNGSIKDAIPFFRTAGSSIKT